MDVNYIKRKREERDSRIKTYANAKDVTYPVAAIWVDGNARITTNRKMLNEAGFQFEDITKDNYQEIISAMDQIGVTLMDYEHLPQEKLIDILGTIVDEEIPECWGGPDMREYVSMKGKSNV